MRWFLRRGSQPQHPINRGSQLIAQALAQLPAAGRRKQQTYHNPKQKVASTH
jgi:hypothetical protein